MHKDVTRILYSKEQIEDRVREIGRQITKEYEGQEVVFVAILKGSVVFLADLIRNVELDSTLDFATVSSYGNGTTSGELVMKKDVSVDVEGKNVIIVEDILDSGKTMDYLYKHFTAKKPKSLKSCVLLDKKVEKLFPIKADYTCFECEDLFVVGYGLDYAQYYRALPYIGELNPSVYS